MVGTERRLKSAKNITRVKTRDETFSSHQLSYCHLLSISQLILVMTSLLLDPRENHKDLKSTVVFTRLHHIFSCFASESKSLFIFWQILVTFLMPRTLFLDRLIHLYIMRRKDPTERGRLWTEHCRVTTSRRPNVSDLISIMRSLCWMRRTK